MQHPTNEFQTFLTEGDSGPFDDPDTGTTREHGWVDDDYDDFPCESADGYTASDHVRRADDGQIWEPHTSYSPYETEDPFTYGAERGYAQPARPTRDRSPLPSRGSTRRERF